ncbi:L-arabinose isomerase family protein, partial [Segatella buccae]
IDMDFMNLNQSAHGDREFAHILTRLRKPRKTVIGYWKDEKTQERIAVWERVCAGWADSQDMLILRFGDQMNNVAVTDGDKVAAEQVLGYHVDYMPFSEVMTFFNEVKDADVTALVKDVYFKEYQVAEDIKDENSEAYRKVWNAAKAELTLRAVMAAKGAKGFTTNFDDLGDVNVEETGKGFDQIPGLASQRMMSDGFGFGAEGDWKSAALYRTVWFMSQGLDGGTSFLEDYTLNFDGDNTSILESHMLEINPDIAEEKPRLEVHFLGIGVRKTPTARLVFTAKQGHGTTATIVDMGNRFRLIANDVNLIKSKPLPKLPVASALWIPEPTFEVGVGCWLNAGGTHHSCFSFGLTDEYWRDYAEIADIECCIINKDTDIEHFRQDLRMNEVYYMLNKALR